MEITPGKIPETAWKPQQPTVSSDSLTMTHSDSTQSDSPNHNYGYNNAWEWMLDMLHRYWPALLLLGTAIYFGVSVVKLIGDGTLPPLESIPGYFINLSLLTVAFMAHSLRKHGLLLWMCLCVCASTGYLNAGVLS